jgi:hypothetical protein
MNITARDIIKNVAAALAIAFLLYISNILAEYLVIPYEFNFQRTTLLDKTGYLFQFSNYTSSVLESANVLIAHPLNSVPS